MNADGKPHAELAPPRLRQVRDQTEDPARPEHQRDQTEPGEEPAWVSEP